MTTTFEYVYATIWMVIGTNFFSFTIGNISTLIAAMDEKDRTINQNINILREYSRKYGLPKES